MISVLLRSNNYERKTNWGISRSRVIQVLRKMHLCAYNMNAYSDIQNFKTVFIEHMYASYAKRISKKFNNLTKIKHLNFFIFFILCVLEKSLLVCQFESDRSNFFTGMFSILHFIILWDHFFSFSIKILQKTKNRKMIDF